MINAKRQVRKNIVDPFTSLVLAASSNIEKENILIEIQSASTVVRNIFGVVGKFHQSILGEINGWKNHDIGYDLIDVKRKMIAEIKNKHNTMNQSNKEKVVDELDTEIKQKDNKWKGYLVHISFLSL